MKKYLAWVALAAFAYVAISYFSFSMPASLEEAQLCGFVEGDFNATGQLAYPPVNAWWISFTRMGEYWSAISVAPAVGFVVYALQVGRRAGAGRAAGAAAGGGLLALSALCVSCLAPVLSAVGLGLAASLLAGVPKWLIALNTLLLTGWGVLLLSRRAAACPLPAASCSPASDRPSHNTSNDSFIQGRTS